MHFHAFHTLRSVVKFTTLYFRTIQNKGVPKSTRKIFFNRMLVLMKHLLNLKDKRGPQIRESYTTQR